MHLRRKEQGSRAHLRHIYGMHPASSLQQSQLWKTIQLWFKEYQIHFNSIHSQKSLSIPKHNYFPKVYLIYQTLLI